MRVPLLDLGAQHAPLRSEIEASVAAVLDTTGFIGGPAVARFETEFAAYCGVEHAVTVSSGTAALQLALQAAGVGAGDEVITSAMTFVATVEAIVNAGATPVLVDPDPRTGLLDPGPAAAAITERTAALLPVHLYGHCVDLRGFRALADRHGLFLLEDACQAHGAWRDGVQAGAVGDAAAFSFYPGKNLGALGDGGALTTGRADIAERVARLRDHGRIDKYLHAEIGTTARLDALQCAALSVKLPHLDGWNARRREHAEAYDAAFGELGIAVIAAPADARSVYHHYVLLCDDRDAIAAGLDERGIATGVHYPVALHDQPAVRGRARHGELPGAERLASSVLSIPVHPDLTTDQRCAVIDAVTAVVPCGAAA
jgi:dTDP-4-amino-4,6-dideoxygalactose transaminase